MKIRRSNYRTLLAVLAGLTAPLSAQQDRIAGAIDSTAAVTLRGTVNPKAKAENDVGLLDPSRRLNYVSLFLKKTAAQQAALDRLLREQQDPSSENYHRWLTPETYADRFGVRQDDLSKLTTWLQAEGMTIEATARGRNFIAFSGTVAQAQPMFHTEFHRYRVDGEDHFANATEISVPKSIADLIEGLGGFDDFVPKPVGRSHHAQPQDILSNGKYALSPSDLATIYNLNPLYTAGFDGTGQSIAVIGQSGVQLSDIQQFRSQFNLPVNDPVIMPPVGPDPGMTNADNKIEANLDLEWSGAVAPNAQIFYIYATDAFVAAEYAIDHNIAPVLSFSFGDCEAGRSPHASKDRSFAQYGNSMGITWIAASGDSGAAGCDQKGAKTAINGLSATYPATIPEITGVGGTTFNEGSATFWSASGSALGYIPETAWNDSGSLNSLAASGGGPSSLFEKPGWQTGFGPPNDSHRDTPDIALTASRDHDGYQIVFNGQPYLAGGTSAAAPSFAGILAILNQYLAAKGQAPRVGNINPPLYRLSTVSPQAFHDVIDGNNIVSCQTDSKDCVNGSFGWKAGAGYDLVTGLGSVDANNLVTLWSASLGSAGRDSHVALSVNAEYLQPPDSSGHNFALLIALNEENGAPTNLKTFSIDGNSQPIDLFGRTNIEAYGTLLAQIPVSAETSSTHLFVVAGMDPGGRQWSVQMSVQYLSSMAIAGLRNSASFQPTFAPGMVLSVFGSGLSPSIASAAAVPLPMSLAGVSATVNGQTAPLYFVSPSQLNIQVPYETQLGSATLSVNNSGQAISFPFTVTAVAPGIFVDTNSNLVPASSAKPGDYVSLYLTGAGQLAPPVGTGTAPPPGTTIAQLPVPKAPVTVTVGGAPATVAFVGDPVGLVGVIQVNFIVPQNLPAGPVPVVATVGSAESAPARLMITSSSNSGGTKVYVLRSGDPDSDNALVQLLSSQGYAVTLGVRAADFDENAVRLSDYNSVVVLGGSSYNRGVPASGLALLRHYVTNSGGLIADGSIIDVELRGDTMLAPLLPATGCGDLAGRSTSLTRVSPTDGVLPASLPATVNLSLFPVFFGTTTYTETCLSSISGASNLYYSQQADEAKPRPGIVAGEVGPTSRVGALSVPIRKWVLDNADFGSVFGGVLQWIGAKTQVTQPAPGSVPAGPLRIFVLRSGDSDSDNQVLKSLSDRGHMPTLGPLATAFDGSGVDLTNYQAVVALGGVIGYGDMPAGGVSAIKNYLYGAGGLVADSQLLQNELRNDRTVVQLLPGTGCGELTHGTTAFEMVGPSDPILMNGVAPSFNVGLTQDYIGTRTYNESCLSKTDGARIFEYSLSAGEDTPHPAVLGNEPDVHSRAVLYSTAIERRELGEPSFLSLFVNTVEWVAAHK